MSTNNSRKLSNEVLLLAYEYHHASDEEDDLSEEEFRRIIEPYWLLIRGVIFSSLFDTCVDFLERAMFHEHAQETLIFRANLKTKTFLGDPKEMCQTAFGGFLESIYRNHGTRDLPNPVLFELIFSVVLAAYHEPLCWGDLTREELAFLEDTIPFLRKMFRAEQRFMWDGSPRPVDEPLDARSRVMVLYLLRRKGRLPDWYVRPANLVFSEPKPETSPPPAQSSTEPPAESETPPVGGVIFRA